MLYSLLYQSIRLVLFGSLTAVALSAQAATVSGEQALPAPKSTSLSGQKADNTLSQTITYKNSRRVASDTLAKNPLENDIAAQKDPIAIKKDPIAINSWQENALATDDAHDHLSTEPAVIPVSVTAINDAKVSDDLDSDINGDLAASYPDKAKTATAKVNPPLDSQVQSFKPERAEQNSSTSTDQALNPQRLNVSDESIQESLSRLAQFYELTPKTTEDAAPPATQNGAKVLPKLGNNLTLLRRNFDTAERCEGQWVYPQPNPNYQRAVAEAGGINTANGLNNQAPIFTESDYGYYDNVDYAELAGNVVINQGSNQIAADKVILDLTTGVASAQGKVMFTDKAIGNQVTGDLAQFKDGKLNISEKAGQGGLIGVADSLAYSTESGQSTAYGVAFASVPLQAHGYAKRLNHPSDTQYELDEVMFSTCPPTDRKWQLEAKGIDLDTETGRGKAYDTTFRILDVPVFYLPYFNFPIDSRRTSGFLLPSASIGSESGLEVDIPYYLNLAPNYDATFNTHIYTNRNPMLSGEFRYLTDDFGEGIINGSYLPNDRKYNDEDRSSLFFDHYWASKDIPRLSGDAKYSYVSDADYLNDFDTLGLSKNTLNLPRRARVNYYNDFVDGELKVETFQTLNAIINNGEPLQDKDKPYSRLPQLQLNYRLPWLTGFDISGVSDSAYFKKSIDDGSEAEKSGVRLYNKISAAYPLENAWGYVNPKLSLQHLYTSYDKDSLDDNNLTEQDGSQSVFVPQASIDAGLHFYRSGSPFGKFDDSLGGYQLLNPRLKYTYSPYKDQNDIPNFNTRIASINYEQLFSDSWFLGHDRLQDLHAITPGINYRYIDATGVTRLDASIAEQFYIDKGRVTLDDNKPVFDSSSSGMVWTASAQPYNNVWVDVSGALNHSYDLNFFTTELRYQPTENSLFNVGFVKRKLDDNTNQLPLTALTGSTIFPVNNNWRVLAQGQYDYRDNKMLDALVGVDYEDCCFGFAVYGRRYYNDLNTKDEPTQAIMAEVRLNGLGSGSSRLTKLLSEKVLGFEPVQSSWKD